MSDLISRADAMAEFREWVKRANENGETPTWNDAVSLIGSLPSAELPKGDLISRADVLKYPIRLDHYDEVNGDRVFVYGVESVIEYVESLPSADAEWIPCSEKLPSESDDYICTIPLDAEETYTEVLTFHKGRFYEDDDEWGATYHDDVLAWMPLPAPYKGGDDE